MLSKIKMDSISTFFRGRYATCLLIAIAFGLSGSGQAQAQPDMTKEQVRLTPHKWNLGPTGIRSWMPYSRARDVAFTERVRQILVIDVAEGSPADGLVRKDDVILGIDGQAFDSDARMAFGHAITEAEREENGGKLNLLVWRDGATREVTLQLKVLGSYSDTSPWDCEKSQRIVEAGLKHAADNLTNNIPGRFNALALLKSGRPEYADVVRKYFRELGPPDLELSLQGRGSGDLGGGYVSWHWGHALIALAEYHLATGDDYVLPAIKTLADTIARGQSAFGTWGHVMAFTPEYYLKENNIGLLGGYGALNSSALTLHYGLVLAQRAGADNDNIRRAVEKSNEFFKFYVGKGSIPYGDHGPWHRHSNNGKNALAALMFNAQGEDEAARYLGRMTVASYHEREHGHTGPYFSFAWGPLGAYTLGQDAVVEFLKPQRWYYDLIRQWDGSFEFHGRGTYTNWDMTGVFLLTYMLSEEPRLDMTGRNRNEALTLSDEELQATIDAGKGFTLHDDGETYYDERSVAELLNDLTSWSPTQRGRAAAALGRRSEVGVVGQLLEMLESDDLDTQLGAAEAIKELGSKASDAAPQLESILKNADDMWLRVLATEALANMGEAAHPAIPIMLRVAKEADDDDPRQMLQRYVARALFGTILASGDISARDIDRQELLETVAAVLTNPSGDFRRSVHTVYEQLDYEELRPILPAILLAVMDPGVTGIMFSDRIRLKGLDLLTRNHVREALPLSLDLMEPERWNYHFRFTRLMDYIERYEGAAKPLVPKLREFRDIDHQRQTDGRVKQVNDLIESIERHYQAGNIPELRSIIDDLPADYEHRQEREEHFRQIMREFNIEPI